MSAIRYSGQLVIRVTYLEPYLTGDTPPAGRSTRLNGEYRCFIRRADHKARVTIVVGAPAVLEHAVDSPEAFDHAASAAIAFADAEYGDWGEWCDRDTGGVAIWRQVHQGRGRSASAESNDGA